MYMCIHLCICMCVCNDSLPCCLLYVHPSSLDAPSDSPPHSKRTHPILGKIVYHAGDIQSRTRSAQLDYNKVHICEREAPSVLQPDPQSPKFFSHMCIKCKDIIPDFLKEKLELLRQAHTHTLLFATVNSNLCPSCQSQSQTTPQCRFHSNIPLHLVGLSPPISPIHRALSTALSAVDRTATAVF